jgi:hypothetical protein
MAIIFISILLIIVLLLLNSKRISGYFQNLEEQKEIDFKKRTNLDLWKLTKISPGITMFGSNQFFYTKSEFYFDEDFLYIIEINKPVIKHTISNIIEVTRTPYSLNNRRIWKIIVNESGNQIEYKITTNHSLTTNNFSNFLDKVNENNDSVVDSEWLL